jgi:tetratricopeptide (TPR) repeat protein
MEQIKRRYRQLARKHHPDVAEDADAAQEAFVQISEAYQVLSNPDKRTIYDGELDAEMFRVEPRRPSPPAPSGPVGTTAGARQAGPDPAEHARRLVREAQVAFTRGQFRTAIWMCRQARKLDSRNFQAHVILGDIYRIQGQIEQAIAMYTIATQLNPMDADVAAKLSRLTRQAGRGSPLATRERRAVLKMGLNLMGWSMSAFLFMMLLMSPGKPIAWLAKNLPMVGTWSTMLFSVLMSTGLITGFLLSVNDSVEPLDNAMLFQAVRRAGARPASYPVGVVLLLFNLFSFYVAVGIYVIVGLIQDSLSKSVLKSFAATFALVLIAAMVYGSGGAQVLTFGGNVAFPAVLFGWAVGDMFRPSW